MRIDPWLIELIVVVGSSHTSAERRAVARDAERGFLLRLRRAVYVERSAFERMTPEQQHIVRMRAVQAATCSPVVFSHFSAAVLHGLPILWSRLEAVHTTVDSRGERGRIGVIGHLHAVDAGELQRVGDLLATGVARTVVDVAGLGTLDEGVMVADAALRFGVARQDLLAASDAVGVRRSSTKATDAVLFGHPGGESAAESRARVSEMRLGVEPPVLQFPVRLRSGHEVRVDQVFLRSRGGVEVDGRKKYFDPDMAPNGAQQKIWDEKRREDDLRSRLRGLVRPVWEEAISPARLRPLLARIGVEPVGATFSDYCAAAEAGSGRFVARRPVVQR